MISSHSPLVLVLVQVSCFVAHVLAYGTLFVCFSWAVFPINPCFFLAQTPRQKVSPYTKRYKKDPKFHWTFHRPPSCWFFDHTGAVPRPREVRSASLPNSLLDLVRGLRERKRGAWQNLPPKMPRFPPTKERWGLYYWRIINHHDPLVRMANSWGKRWHWGVPLDSHDGRWMLAANWFLPGGLLPQKGKDHFVLLVFLDENCSFSGVYCIKIIQNLGVFWSALKDSSCKER